MSDPVRKTDSEWRAQLTPHLARRNLDQEQLAGFGADQGRGFVGRQRHARDGGFAQLPGRFEAAVVRCEDEDAAVAASGQRPALSRRHAVEGQAGALVGLGAGPAGFKG